MAAVRALQLLSFLLLLSTSLLQAKVIFKEEFDENWMERWTLGAKQGKWTLTSGKWYGDVARDRGIQTSQDAQHYAVSARFSEPFDNAGSSLVVQFQLKFEQNIDCGGGYIKLMPAAFDQSTFSGDSEYYIMFGPDVCGSTRKTHVIFAYKGKNVERTAQISAEIDQLSHLYTLELKPDNTYEVWVDQVSKAKGQLESDFAFLPAKEINDPDAKKPVDWVDNMMMDDPEDIKPEGYDDIPEFIVDPDAVKPEDWDDEEDGEWNAPQINNPEFKGEWSPKQIKNPEYKGPWVHPQIPNPAYVPDENLYHYGDLGGVGIELWQVKSGTIFDNIIVASSKKEADDLAAATWSLLKAPEKEMKEKFDKLEEAKEETEEDEEDYGEEDPSKTEL